MKKYVKPELFFESFELSQQIAACQYDSNNTHSDIYNCEFVGDSTSPFPGVKIFLTEDVCTVEAQSYCEHNGSGTSFNIFNS